MYRFTKFVTFSLIFMLLVGIMPAAAQEDNAQRNKQIYLDVVAEYNAGNWQAFYDMVTDPFMMNQGEPTLAETSRDDVIGYDQALVSAMPDIQMNADVVIAQDDWVATHVTYTGTFTEPFSFPPFGPDSFPANNEAITWTELDFLHFNADGLVDEVWAISDPSVLFGQLGIFPPSEDSATGTPVDSPVGYQLLTDEEWDATLSSGMEERNVDLFQSQLVFGEDTSWYYADTFISWTNGIPSEVTASVQAEEDMAFTGVLAQAMPDHVISADILVAEGDWVASLVTVDGTFSADTDFFGMPLTHTNEEIVWQVGILDHFNADGKVSEEWFESDVTPLLVGLGMMPPMDEGE